MSLGYCDFLAKTFFEISNCLSICVCVWLKGKPQTESVVFCRSGGRRSAETKDFLLRQGTSSIVVVVKSGAQCPLSGTCPQLSEYHVIVVQDHVTQTT